MPPLLGISKDTLKYFYPAFFFFSGLFQENFPALAVSCVARNGSLAFFPVQTCVPQDAAYQQETSPCVHPTLACGWSPVFVNYLLSEGGAVVSSLPPEEVSLRVG